MVSSTRLRKVEKLVSKIDAKLRADDKRFRRIVHVVHGDGSTMTFINAFLMWHKDENGRWIIIFTEHNGTHVYHAEDLEHWGQYSQHITIDKLV